MSKPKVNEEQRELLLGFVEEGREMLEEVEPQLIALEQSAAQQGDLDANLINGIFRLFHSLKGSAGYLGLQTISQVTHQAETLLDLFRKGAYQLGSANVDLLMRTCDFMRQLLERVAKRQTDSGLEAEAKGIIADLQSAIADMQIPTSTITMAPVEAPAEESGAAGDLQLAFTPELIQQFISESQELLEKAEESLLQLERESDNQEYIAQAFRALHSFKGNAGLFGYGDLEKLSHQAETVLENIKEHRTAPGGEIFSLLLEVLDVLRQSLVSLAGGGSAQISGLLGWLSLLLETTADPLPQEDDPENFPAVPEMEEGGSETAEQQAGIPSRKTQEVRAPGQPESNPMNKRRAGDERRSGADRRQKEEGAVTPRQSVRVDVEKLDKLLDLVGELVIAEAMVAQNPDLKTIDLSLDRFEKSVLHLEKISRDLQDNITAIRMIPLSGTFRRTIRLVRDLAQKADKKVELELIGEETEVDKTVIEQINDPLVHLMRNAIDHGIETQAQRAAAGKTETSRIVLEAKYVGSEVWISLRDDGRGLNREKIVTKAQEKGLLTGDGADLRDEEVWQIIFQPGFSTADTVTDVSGRGVGMDVVKRNIENLRGKVAVRSKKGQGTEISLRLPLTLAIIDGMIVRVGQAHYIIPIASIKESLRPKDGDITPMMDGQEVVNIRGALVPVVRLHEIFNLPTNCTCLSDGLIIVVENQGQVLCLFVEELVGQQQVVIKGLSSYIGDLPGISGCTILGDGSISLIIDIAGIFNITQNKAEQTA